MKQYLEEAKAKYGAREPIMELHLKEQTKKQASKKDVKSEIVENKSVPAIKTAQPKVRWEKKNPTGQQNVLAANAWKKPWKEGGKKTATKGKGLNAVYRVGWTKR